MSHINSFTKILGKLFCNDFQILQSGILYDKRVDKWPFTNTLPLTEQVRKSKVF